MGLSLARATCETSQVLLAGGQVFFLGGSPVFAPPNDWLGSKWVKESWRAINMPPPPRFNNTEGMLYSLTLHASISIHPRVDLDFWWPWPLLWQAQNHPLCSYHSWFQVPQLYKYYRKNPKNVDTQKVAVIILKFKQIMLLYYRVMSKMQTE